MRRVLVIDDDKFIGVAIEAILRRKDYDVIVADSEDVRSKRIEASDFDVAIVDIFMPGMDGFEIIKVFRKCAPEVPIVAMSGYRFRNSTSPAPDFLEMAMRYGASYRLSKPFGPRQLWAAINACLADQPLRDCAMGL